ncbi:phage tail sheath C-terminal domain-containing protein [Azospirillum sp. B4]|uniref:phage tail sheath family protein n=1 Tax=Azospirillum sp. B4 TaxID=95605 RepID=UPI00034B04AC|nr:phage tail sheath C-terminal domain-containing protein [Azospirillum sp. B4]
MATYSTPGVYINELNAFPNSVVPVATAVPVFIGYTPRADYQGKSYYNKPVRISSFAEYQAYFSLPNPAAPADPARQYMPQYYLTPQNQKPDAGPYLSIGGKFYSILPDPNTIYYMYNSVRLFYLNGGGDAWIVPVGSYGAPSGKPLATAKTPLVNTNVTLADLQRGLTLLRVELEPTIYICPEATLLTAADNATLMQSMLLQAQDLQTTVCLFDVINGNQPDPTQYTQDIAAFRDATGTNGLKYGISYYPFVGTTVMQSGEIDFTNLFGGDIKQLAPLLNPPDAPDPAAAKIIAMIETPPATPLTTSQLHNALLNASKTYGQIIQQVMDVANLLPPSGAMAGVYTVNDNTRGVWNSPANTSIVGAASLPIRLSDSQQENLNIDAVSGKSINAIRFFTGQGILIWGARTLDGNSQDWRYVSVRRTMIFLEQSVKRAAHAYAFGPNTANTWAAVKSMISSFLTDVWKQGGLQGARPDDAFQVLVGLGSTMTPDDLKNGILRVTVLVAVVRPAEFIEITFEQQMAKDG